MAVLLGAFDSRHGALGLAVATAAIVLAVLLAHLVLRPLARRRAGAGDPYRRYVVGKVVTYGFGFAGAIALLVIWAPLGGRLTFIIGLAAAGLGFGLQPVIGAIFGWVNILSGRVFRVGDRIEFAGVRGDVIDLTPLRTKVLEMGQAGDELPGEGVSTWVHGRQYTGRIVTISNQATFTNPVYNYSSTFDYIWEELTLPIPYRCDWREADRILLDEARRASASEEARQAMAAIERRYPVPQTEIEPRVFARATDNWMELSARFVLPVRSARSVKDALTRRIVERLEEAGIEVASATSEVTVRFADALAETPVPQNGGGRTT